MACEYPDDLTERIFRGLYPGLPFARSSSGELYGVMLGTTLLASDTLGGLADLVNALSAHSGKPLHKIVIDMDLQVVGYVRDKGESGLILASPVFRAT